MNSTIFSKTLEVSDIQRTNVRFAMGIIHTTDKTGLVLFKLNIIGTIIEIYCQTETYVRSAANITNMEQEQATMHTSTNGYIQAKKYRKKHQNQIVSPEIARKVRKRKRREMKERGGGRRRK